MQTQVHLSICDFLCPFWPHFSTHNRLCILFSHWTRLTKSLPLAICPLQV